MENIKPADQSDFREQLCEELSSIIEEY